MKKTIYDIKITSGEFAGHYNYTDIDDKERAKKLAREIAQRMQLTNEIVEREVEVPDDDIVTAFFKG